MNGNNLELCLAILSGLATAIPLVIQLVKYVKAAIKEKNWNKVLELVMSLMATAETKFTTGSERKEWVMMMVKATSDTIDYDINMDEISKLIDALAAMSKAVNYKEEVEEVSE